MRFSSCRDAGIADGFFLGLRMESYIATWSRGRPTHSNAGSGSKCIFCAERRFPLMRGRGCEAARVVLAAHVRRCFLHVR